MIENVKYSFASNPTEFIEEQTPLQIRRALVTDVVLPAYSTTRRATSSWSEQLKRDGFMDLVQYEIQNNLNFLPLKFPDYLKSFSTPNVSGSNFHTELLCGRVIFTISQTRFRGKLPREAYFRSALANDFNQSLFEPELPTGDITYIILTHGVDENDRRFNLPSFAELVIPDELTRSVICQYDLSHFIHEATKEEFASEEEVRLVKAKTKQPSTKESEKEAREVEEPKERVLKSKL
jgi:hypothetical protein